MIVLAQRLRPGSRGLGRSLLLLIAVTAAIIAGLLAMHSLNSHTEPAAPATAIAGHEHGAAVDEHVAAAVTGPGTVQPVTDGECADCGGHAGMLAMACVLALLLVALLILVPRGGVSWGVALRAGPALISRAALHPRPPSLLVLCISRT